MAQVKRDDVKQGWEESDFPLVCETCLGDNPYVRMTREPHGKKCQVCETPFTVFAWQAGTKGRLKRVEICKACARAKNVCQVCIYDLQYGLPVKVRDKVLREAAAGVGGGGAAGGTGAGGGAGGGPSDPTALIPQSNANRAWFAAQQQRMVESGQGPAASQGGELAHARLREMAQMEPRYERNLPKLCSFYARGECDRGSSCPFRHEMPRDRADPMSKQNTKDRFYGTSDPVANKILGRKRRQDEVQERREEGAGFDRAPCTLYLRLQGDPPYPALTERDVRDQFYAFGEIVSVRLQPGQGQGFVEYTSPEATELAISSMNRKEVLGRPLFCSWARAPKRGEALAGGGGAASAGDHGAGTAASGSAAPAAAAVRPRPPPGAGAAASSLPALPSVKLPPEVAAMAAARKQRLMEGSGGGGAPAGGPAASSTLLRPPRGTLTSVPRPSGAASYPSTDPQRLGSKAAASPDQ